MEPVEKPRGGEVTELLAQAHAGDRQALDRLLPIVYAELRRVAERQMRGERPGHTLGVSGLVHEVYLRLAEEKLPEWRGREHFYAVAGRAMHQILIDYARRRSAEKRGGDWNRTSIDEQKLGFASPVEELLAVDEALQRLERVDPRLRQLIEYRFFCGLTEQETADVLGVTTRTVQRDWAKARAWLYRELYPEAR